MAVLTTRGRKRLKSSDFALKGGRFPINDLAHARNALARAAQPQVNLSASERATIRRKVYARYPALKERTQDGGTAKKKRSSKLPKPRRSASPCAGPRNASSM